MKTVNVQTKQDNTATLLDVGGAWVGLMATVPQLMTDEDSANEMADATLRGLRSTLRMTMPITYQPTEINACGNHYLLDKPLNCRVEFKENAFFIYYDPLKIVAVGETWDDAKIDFDEWFDHLYVRLNELGNDRLAPRLQSVRDVINKAVKTVVQ